MVFRPATLNSKHHKRLTQAVERHHVKTKGVQKTTTTEDPAKAKVGPGTVIKCARHLCA